VEGTLGSRVVVGAVVKLLGGVPIHALTVLTTLLCFRTLSPGQYGAYSLALAIYGFSDIFTNPSVGTYLVRKKDCSAHTIDVAFTISALRGAVLTPVFWFVSPLLAQWFGGDATVVTMLRIMCLGFFFMGMKNLHVIRYSQELQMGRVLLVDSLGSFIGAALGISLLLIFESPLALVVGSVSRNVFNTVFSWAFSPQKPKWVWDEGELRQLWNFTRFLLLNSLIIYALHNLDDLMVAKLVGVASLGLYSISFGIVNSALMFLIKPLHEIVLPALAKLQDNRVQLTKAMLSIMSTYAFLSWMICSALWLVAEDLFTILGHTEQWSAGAPIFRALLPFVLIRGINGSMGQFMLALGKPRVITYVAGLQLALMIPFGILGLKSFGFIGLVWAITVANGLTLCFQLLISRRYLATRLSVQIATILLPVPSALTSVYASSFTQSWIDVPVMRLGVGVITSLVVFVGLWELVCKLPLGPIGRQSVGQLLERFRERGRLRAARKSAAG
jgi:O-antigen/teichoic acid export membrane protein